MNNPVYTAEARIEGGRDKGRGWTPRGELDVRLRLPEALGGNGDGANPEQLFAIGYAGCFEAVMMAAAKTVGLRGSDVRDVAIDARVLLLKGDDATFTLGAELDVELPSVDDPEKAVELIHAAHRLCPYSRAIRGNVDVAITVNGIEVDSHLATAA